MINLELTNFKNTVIENIRENLSKRVILTNPNDFLIKQYSGIFGDGHNNCHIFSLHIIQCLNTREEIEVFEAQVMSIFGDYDENLRKLKEEAVVRVEKYFEEAELNDFCIDRFNNALDWKDEKDGINKNWREVIRSSCFVHVEKDILWMEDLQKNQIDKWIENGYTIAEEKKRKKQQELSCARFETFQYSSFLYHFDNLEQKEYLDLFGHNDCQDKQDFLQHHVHNCLNTLEEVNEFKDKLLGLAETKKAELNAFKEGIIKGIEKCLEEAKLDELSYKLFNEEEYYNHGEKLLNWKDYIRLASNDREFISRFEKNKRTLIHHWSELSSGEVSKGSQTSRISEEMLCKEESTDGKGKSEETLEIEIEDEDTLFYLKKITGKIVGLENKAIKADELDKQASDLKRQIEELEEELSALQVNEEKKTRRSTSVAEEYIRRALSRCENNKEDIQAQIEILPKK